jgi:hypothetical protein
MLLLSELYQVKYVVNTVSMACLLLNAFYFIDLVWMMHTPFASQTPRLRMISLSFCITIVLIGIFAHSFDWYGESSNAFGWPNFVYLMCFMATTILAIYSFWILGK